MSWLRETARGNRIGAGVASDGDSVMAILDGNAGTRKYYRAHALEPWEARQFALALNAAADEIDPDGNAEPPKATNILT